ncbi:hypothetical protein [Neobacillus terrae]|uniref:hypothetical protein n=1 Tax=Neobacillus terrae TaxID=3034837 RepID=UPI001409AB1D|nr:hypothetical protein [Neobacillus terrae]NHM34000.1 hypothetical protein [Neobacillus terrae]
MKRKLIISFVIMMILFILWWAKYLVFVPHFQAGPNNTLVSRNTELVLVAISPEAEKSGIHIPGFIPFWKTIGVVDGEMKGTLWEFKDNGKTYVSYHPDVEMDVGSVYKYSSSSK